MSLVVGEPTRQCPRCRLLMRRFLTVEPAGIESPWCQACTMKALIKSRPDPPNSDLALPYPFSAVRATLHDAAAPPELRRFAYAVLKDHRWATDKDRRAAALLALAEEQATGAHGTATDGPEGPGPGPGADANRECRWRPHGELGKSTDEGNPR